MRCGAEVSRRRSRSRRTRSPAGRVVVPEVAGRRSSTRRPYKTRNTVARAINRLRGYRAVATRYDKREFVYKGNHRCRQHRNLATPTRRPRSSGHALVMREDAGLERAGQPLLVVLAGPAPLFGEHSVDVRAGECPQDGSGVFAGDPVFAMVRWLRSIQRWWSWRGGVVRDDIAAGPSPRTSWWAPPETHLGSGTSRPAALRRRRAHCPTDRRPAQRPPVHRLRTPRQDINRQTAHHWQSTATPRLTPDPVPPRLRPLSPGSAPGI